MKGDIFGLEDKILPQISILESIFFKSEAIAIANLKKHQEFNRIIVFSI